MSLSRFAIVLGCLLAPLVAQPTLTVVTTGAVPRVPGTPFIPGCPTTLEPFYFQIRGTISQALGPNQEIRLLVRPRLLDGSTIPGCTWVTQCQRAFVLPDNSFLVFGQFGTDNVPRTWFSGQRADVVFALVDRSVGIPVCVADPATVSLAVSNVSPIQLDPTLPTYHDYARPCTSSTMVPGGVPSPGNLIQFQLRNPGAVVFGLHDTVGFPFQGCQVHLNPTFPFILVSTDATGMLSFALPNDPSLVGADIGTQGVQVVAGALDLTQPTLASIR